MEVIYKNTNTEFGRILTECLNYVWECDTDSNEVTMAYMKELTDIIIVDKTNRAKSWEMLISSGVFHDAEGEVAKWNGDEVVVTTEY